MLAPILMRRIKLAFTIKQKEDRIKLIEAKIEINKAKIGLNRKQQKVYVFGALAENYCYINDEQDKKFLEDIDSKIDFLKNYDREPFYIAFALPLSISLLLTIICACGYLLTKENYNKLKEEQNHISEYADYTSDELNKFGIYEVVIQEVNDYNKRLANYRSSQASLGNWAFWKDYDLSGFEYIKIKGQS